MSAGGGRDSVEVFKIKTYLQRVNMKNLFLLVERSKPGA